MRLAFIVVLEHGIDRVAEHVGNSVGYIDRRRISAVFDRAYRSTAHAHEVGQLLLRHLAVRESELPDLSTE